MIDWNLWLTVGAIAVLLAMSAFFSGSETALTAASRARLLQYEKQGSRRAGTAAKLMEMRERLIGALLVGNNLVNILSSALATQALLRIFGDTAIVYATIIMTTLVLVFSEVLPKTLAILRPEGFALAVAPVVRVIVILFAPVTSLVNHIVALILRMFGVHADAATVNSAREEIRGAVDLQHAEGGLHKSDRDRLGAILDLAELDVSDVMVHRTRMRMLDAALPPAELVAEAAGSPHTRLPLFEGETDNIVGILHAKDLLRAVQSLGGDMERLNVRAIAKPPWFVPESTMLHDQLNAFLKRKAHFALVVDEYGEVMGLVTLEDIIEEIVGEIEDEYDNEVEGLRVEPDGTVLVDGSVSIRDLNRALDWELPDDEATTAAGLVIHEAQMIPDVGQAFTFHGVRFEVAERERNRITLLKLNQQDAE
ncbi:HlyC/CorC family transporter [Acuticoccus sp. I52.16.1]|uniref:HlyC/CorC family transporter n=1 Tax=Acuticoccus sp. I52.16.1 TaxID=2928472 RepID=UPI001FD52195|nr:HlyC/CorC family transporter [Acuticoccus sp. I52.16.1]UOM33634.1 HlyC/CorC family transporter [Acuticoccus sp. I52.16.1]